jgi:asparagine synthase (glutamine-hydrolysing)
MCGIVGVVSKSAVASNAVERMRDQLAHRGPDHAGLWLSQDGRVCLGHRRLSIIDLDVRSNQPMSSYDDRFKVTFNGEIYNYRHLRRRLEREGVRFCTESDTEVLIEAYRRWGEDSLDLLSGMYAFAIWDAQDQRLFCARDRAGEKPFYYAFSAGVFLFASEIKALLEWPQLPRRIDYDALIDFLTLGFIADPKSIWLDVRKLPPAHAMAVEISQDGELIVCKPPRRYWSLAFVSRPKVTSSEEIRATLLAAAKEMAVADVPLGTFLSGGVDSSSVTAALSLSGHPVQSFTIGFDLAQYDERQWARQVAERYHTCHAERTVEPTDVLTVINRLNWHYDEPFGDYSSFPTYYLCREARHSITVALSGDGADELFAGYRKYQRLVRRSELGAVFPAVVASSFAAVARQALGEGSHWRRTLTQYGLDAPQMLADMLCLGFSLPLLREVARGPLAQALRHYDPQLLVEQLLVAAPPDKVGLVNAMRHLDFALTLPGDILVKIDRASMAVALEVRPLFLHRDVMELAAGIAPEQLVNHNAAKLALKTAVRPWLPNALLDRPKQGFALPLPEWLTTNSSIATRIRGADTSARMRELLDIRRIGKLRAAHAQRRSTFTSVVHAAFILDQWFARWSPS